MDSIWGRIGAKLALRTERAAHAGDFTGTARIEYTPFPDGDADPGEVVWGWVPFEEGDGHGKDRPALVIGRDGGWLLALMLSRRDNDRDARAPSSTGAASTRSPTRCAACTAGRDEFGPRPPRW